MDDLQIFTQQIEVFSTVIKSHVIANQRARHSAEWLAMTWCFDGWRIE